MWHFHSSQLSFGSGIAIDSKTHTHHRSCTTWCVACNIHSITFIIVINNSLFFEIWKHNLLTYSVQLGHFKIKSKNRQRRNRHLISLWWWYDYQSGLVLYKFCYKWLPLSKWYCSSMFPYLGTYLGTWVTFCDPNTEQYIINYYIAIVSSILIILKAFFTSDWYERNYDRIWTIDKQN